MRLIRIFATIIPLLMVVTSVQAQTALRIAVTDGATGSAVSRALVSVTRPGGNLLRSETDSTGSATFPDLRGGTHSISVQATGYETTTPRKFDLEAGIFTDINISLTPAPIALKPVEATVAAVPPGVPDLKLNGFYERMKLNNGIFIDQAEIEKRDQRLISDLIRSKAGVNLRPDVGGEQLMWFRTNEGMSLSPDGGVRLCGPTIFLDGIVVHHSDGEKASPIDRYVKTTDLVGIEIYRRPSQIPEQYGGANSACGIVLLWTRVRS